MKTLKKQTKIIAALLLVAILTLCLASCASSSAQAEDASGDHGSLKWSYTKEDKTLKISGSGEIASFDSASAVVWSAVRSSAEKIVVSDGITSIGSYAFYMMSALKEVTLPATLTAIGDYAFGYASALESITLPSSLTAIGKGAFEGCGSLRSLFIPSSVTRLGERAFAYCYSMQKAIIVGPVSEIKSETFKNCTALDSLIVRTTLNAESVDETAFSGAKISFDSAVKTDSADGSAIITIHYVDTAGTAVAEDLIATVPYGQGYTYNSPAITGYTTDQLTVSGTADGINQEITVIYTAVESPSNPSETPEENQNDKEKEPVTVGTFLAIGIMLIVLIGIGIGAFLLIRSDKNATSATVRKNQNKTKK